MKKTLLLALMLMLSIATNAQSVADKIATSFKGELKLSMPAPITDETPVIYVMDEEGNPKIDENGQPIKEVFTVTITKQSDNSVQFRLPNFGFMGMNLGDIVLDNRPVVADEANKRTLFGENDPVNLSFMGGLILATAKINPATSYILDSGEAFVDVDVVWTNTGGDPMPIYVRFTGKSDVTTGIAIVQSKAAQAQAFDLQGRPANAATKGIVIKNGKKVLR